MNEEDKESWSYLATIKKETRIPLNILSSQVLDLCKCEIEKKLSVILHFTYELEDFQSLNRKLMIIKNSLLQEFKECISSSREVFKNLTKDCHHEVKDMQNEFRNIIEEGGNTDEFVRKQLGKIKNIVANISVAPSEHGEFKNWCSELFLEEKLFPNLFPYGIGGYMSSNLLRGSVMGFANYIKSRILSADPKFRNDKTYLLFMLLVKELTDIKNSEQTFLRKSTKSANLTASLINSIGKEHLYRYDSAFVTFKNIRGTNMYFQDAKKRLMATLRQKGSPTLFVTFSCAEYEWLDLAKSIYETVHKTSITIEEIRNLPTAEKNKLISDNVVQSTLHFSKRTDKLMSLLKGGGIFFHNGEEYVVDSYFYRIEFQARGAPHSHCLLWLRSKDNESPPSMWNDDIHNNEDLCESIASFCDSIMSGSSDDMNCDQHEEVLQDCEECQRGRIMVEKFQSHKHSFSCHKKGKKIRIQGNEGHGRLDKHKVGEELLLDVCRLRHPKVPIDRTEFIRAFSQDTNAEVLKRAKQDYNKIYKYLLRLTHTEDFKTSQEWQHFKSLSFSQFLFEVGMIDDTDTGEIQFTMARQRYLTALRCSVKSSGLLILKRETRDIFTNNFNKQLMLIHGANMDIQYCSDPYAVAEYMIGYVLKSEAGTSLLLKNINDEAVREGGSTLATVKRIGQALDRGREVSVQEAVYRILGLPMTKFSDVVKFIDTQHPERREGLLKSNLNELSDDEPIFHNSIHTYYEMRPFEPKGDHTSECWSKICLADFVANYNLDYGKKTKNSIKLLDNKNHISKRQRPCVLRYYLKYEHDEEYLRALLILFLPFRHEIRDIHSHDVKELYATHKNVVDTNRMKYEKFHSLVEKVEQIEMDEVQDEMEEAYSEYLEEETTRKEDIEDFENKIKKDAKRILNNGASEQLMEEEQYLTTIQMLNVQQRKIFDDFVHRLYDSLEDDPFYLYIGGNAGKFKSKIERLKPKS